MIAPTDVRVVIIVNPKFEDDFLEHIFKLGYHWFHKDFEKLKDHLETKGTILIRTDDPFLDRLCARLDKDDCIGKIFYLVACKYLLYEKINYISHYTMSGRNEWGELNIWYKNIYGNSFNDELKEN